MEISHLDKNRECNKLSSDYEESKIQNDQIIMKMKGDIDILMNKLDHSEQILATRNGKIKILENDINDYKYTIKDLNQNQ